MQETVQLDGVGVVCSCVDTTLLSLFAKSVNLQLLVRSKSGIVNYLIHSNYK
jgi:hypothetical protein